MNKFNEFLIKIDGINEILEILFLLLIFLFFMLLVKDALLGVNCSHYRYKNLAKNWYEYVKQTIENSEYTDLAGAMGILKVLYDEMIREI